MPALTVLCPTCRRTLTVDSGLLGKSSTCGYCNASFRVPCATPPPIPGTKAIEPQAKPAGTRHAAPPIATAQAARGQPQQSLPVTAANSNCFPCPYCGGLMAGAADLAGQQVACAHCRCQFLMPGTNVPQQATKPCPFCAEQIAFSAIKCKHCGSAPMSAASSQSAARVPTGVTVPLLISAVWNCVVGLACLSSCVPLPLAVPFVILCIYEFKLYGKADGLTPQSLASQAHTLAICEIVAGVFNVVSLPCGIIILINVSSLNRNISPNPFNAQQGAP